MFTKVDATQHARVAIEDLENELHSACIVDNVTPIQSGSSATSLQFVSQEGNGATLTPVEHLITYSSTPAASPRPAGYSTMAHRR